MKILGIDASTYQGPTGMSFSRFQNLDDAGVRFAGFRASIGTVGDDSFRTNLNRAEKQGWKSAGYHYLVPGVAAADQARLFATRLGKDVPGWLDVEQSGLNRKHVTDFVRTFRDLKGEHFLGVYTSSYKWRSITGNMDGADLFDGLWNALWTERGTNGPEDLPAQAPKPRYGGWRKADIWQYGLFRPDGGTPLDGNVFYGTETDLDILFTAKQKPPLEERPNYVKGYADATAAVLRYLADGPTLPGEAWAYKKGVADARDDLIAAVKDATLSA